jgi:hypothetical protein
MFTLGDARIEIDRVTRFVSVKDPFNHRILRTSGASFVAVYYRLTTVGSTPVDPSSRVNPALLILDAKGRTWALADTKACGAATDAYAAARHAPHYPEQAVARGQTATTVAVYVVPTDSGTISLLNRKSGRAYALPAATKVR